MNNLAYFAAGQLSADLLDGMRWSRLTLDQLDDFKGSKSCDAAAGLVESHLVIDSSAMKNQIGRGRHPLQ